MSYLPMSGNLAARAYPALRNVLLACLLALGPGLGRAADITWTSPVSGEWGNPANWNGGAGPVPGPSDIAHITADGTYVVNREDDFAVGGIVLGGNSGTAILRVFGPQASFGNFTIMTTSSPSIVNEHGKIELSGARIEGTGSLTLSGRIVSTYLCYIDTPLFTTATSEVLVLGTDSSNGHLTIAGGFTNHGKITLNSILQDRDARLDITVGTLVNSPTGLIEALPGTGGSRNLYAELDNQGTLRVERLLVMDGPPAANNRNSGLIEVTGADFQVLLNTTPGPRPTFRNTGTVSVNAGRTWRVAFGNLFHDAGQITGAGTLALTGGVSGTINAPITIRKLSVTNAAVFLTADLYTSVTGLALSGAEVHGPVTITNSAGETVAAIGANTVSANWHNQGTLIAGAGVLKLNGVISTSPTSRLRVEGGNSGQAMITALNGFANLGALELGSVGADQPAVLRLTNGTLVNAPGATIESQLGAGGSRHIQAPLDNQGLFRVLASLDLNQPSAQHLNTGQIDVTGGDLTITHLHAGQTPRFRNLGQISVSSGRTLRSANSLGVFTNGVGGQLLGRGTYIFDSPLVTEGTLSPGASPGIMSLTGSVAFSNGMLDVEVGGPTVGTEYDRLAVTGSVTFDGTLRITFLDGFCAQPGDLFRIVTAGSRTGTFDAIEVLGAGNPVLDPQYDATGLSLSIVSDLLTVTATAGSHGTIDPSGAVSVACGSDQAFSIAPAPGFGVEDVLVDGASVGPLTSYTFLDVSEHHTISASFVDIAAPAASVVSPNGGEFLLGGQLTTVEWTASDNVAVDSVAVDLSVDGAGGPWVNVARTDGATSSIEWLVPNQHAENALIRVSAKDAAGNTASDVSDSSFRILHDPSGVDESIPAGISLEIPNPASARAVPIRFAVPKASRARLEIVDVNGRRVWATQIEAAPGWHDLRWSGHGEGSGPSQGVYFARLVTPLGRKQIRFVVLR